MLFEKAKRPQISGALTPAQCAELKRSYPDVELVVKSSEVRRITDDEYRAEGIDVVKDMSGCDVLLGVKEVPLNELIPDTTYLFFSHTYKLQPTTPSPPHHLDKRIRLIDCELVKRANGRRVIGFGRWAGIVERTTGCAHGACGTARLPFRARLIVRKKDMVSHAKASTCQAT